MGIGDSVTDEMSSENQVEENNATEIEMFQQARSESPENAAIVSGNTEVVISSPKSVDTLNEKMITVARYAIKYPDTNTRYNDDLVVSYDPETKTTYALRVDKSTNAIKQRVKMTNSDQQVGFGQNALIRFNSGGYEINGASSVNSTTMMVIERYDKGVSGGTWQANYKKETLPANVQLSVNFVDELGNKIIGSDLFSLFQGQSYSITSGPKDLPGYKFIEYTGSKTGDILTSGNLSVNYIYRKVSIVINQPTEGDQVVTGTGTPGDDITLTDKDGNVIGEGKVGEDGKFEITPTRPLVPNEVITATPNTDGKEGTPTDTTVAEKPFDKDAHKPVINQPTEGDKTITGTGTPGDKIEITDKDGNKIGEGTVDENGKFEITPTRPLVPNEVITATPNTDGKEGTPTDTTVAEKPFDKDAHKPVINQPTEGDQVVTGTGTPGDDITLTDKDGNVIGEGKVGEDGKFEITPTRPLVPNEVITATPTTDGKEGTPTDTTVAEKPFDKDAHKPVINQPTEGDQVVTGTGTPGDDIKLTDKDGNVIGEGKVGEDGKFEITPTRPLVPNEVITATPNTDGKEGTPTDSTVGKKPYKPEEHKPTIDPSKEGDKTITGTGTPGDKIEIKDKDGNKIGEGIVGEDGKYEITSTRPTIADEVITAIPDTNGEKGTSTDSTVGKKPFDKDAHKPVINQPTEGDKTITGTGKPGDKIEITDKDGNKIGEGTVDGDGKFEITPTRPIKEGEVITATPDTNGEKGTSTDSTVGKKPYNPEEHKPTIDPSKEGDKTITGTGKPGDKIEITDKDGNKIGEGIVGEDGKYEITPTRPIKEGEVITATPYTDGEKGTSTDSTVGKKTDKPDEQKPTINPPKEGNDKITGTGKLGDKVEITDKDGNMSKNYLPQTGSSESLVAVVIGLMVTIFSGFLFWKKDDKKTID